MDLPVRPACNLRQAVAAAVLACSAATSSLTRSASGPLAVGCMGPFWRRSGTAAATAADTYRTTLLHHIQQRPCTIVWHHRHRSCKPLESCHRKVAFCQQQRAACGVVCRHASASSAVLVAIRPELCSIPARRGSVGLMKCRWERSLPSTCATVSHKRGALRRVNHPTQQVRLFP